MVSYVFNTYADIADNAVLILIVVEDGLVLSNRMGYHSNCHCVLILVVVDNGLVQFCTDNNVHVIGVLILIVVDNGLVHADK